MPYTVGTKGTPRVKERRHTSEQITSKLREADRLLPEGKSIEQVAKHLEVSEQTFERWRNQYGGMKADDAKRLKELERENRELKEIASGCRACRYLNQNRSTQRRKPLMTDQEKELRSWLVARAPRCDPATATSVPRDRQQKGLCGQSQTRPAALVRRRAEGDIQN